MIPAAIADYLERHQARYSLLSHPTAYTAQEEAAAAHVPGHEWAKTVVCFADDQPILAVLPAPFAVDLTRLQRTARAHSIRLAQERELAPLYQDCELGPMPPFGPLYGQRVFVDKRLTTDPEVSFQAGSHHDAIRMPYREFERLVQPTVAEFASGPSLSSSPRTALPSEAVDAAVSPTVTEDVTRDTYGFPSPAPVRSTPEERIADAEREAEQAGIPGVELPESPEEVKERARRREPWPRSNRG